MIDVLKTLQYMKPDIKALVWENDIDRIVYNDLETFRPSKEEILAVDQSKVEQQLSEESDRLTTLQAQLIEIYDEIQQLKEST